MVIKTTDEIWKGYEQSDLNYPSKQRWLELDNNDLELLTKLYNAERLNKNELDHLTKILYLMTKDVENREETWNEKQ